MDQVSSRFLDQANKMPQTLKQIYKKASQDGNLVLYLPQRELKVTEDKVDKLLGVALVKDSLIQRKNDKAKSFKVFVQVVLFFR